MDTQTQIQNLTERVTKLESFIESIKSSANFPIEVQDAFIAKGFLKADDQLLYYGGFSARQFNSIVVRSGFKKYVISTDNLAYYVPVSIDIATNILTTKDGTTMADGYTVIFYSNGDVPVDLQNGQPLYVVNSSGTSFQVSLTIGGAAIDITAQGYGEVYANIIDS